MSMRLWFYQINLKDCKAEYNKILTSLKNKKIKLEPGTSSSDVLLGFGQFYSEKNPSTKIPDDILKTLKYDDRINHPISFEAENIVKRILQWSDNPYDLYNPDLDIPGLDESELEAVVMYMNNDNTPAEYILEESSSLIETSSDGKIHFDDFPQFSHLFNQTKTFKPLTIEAYSYATYYEIYEKLISENSSQPKEFVNFIVNPSKVFPPENHGVEIIDNDDFFGGILDKSEVEKVITYIKEVMPLFEDDENEDVLQDMLHTFERFRDESKDEVLVVYYS